MIVVTYKLVTAFCLLASSSRHEDVARTSKSHQVRHGISAYTPYLPRVMPTVVDESVVVRVTETRR
jgi:hypothetical protein